MAVLETTTSAPSSAWGELATPHSPEDILRAMRALSKAGKLAGFDDRAKAPREAFRVAAFAMPFDRELIAVAREDAGTTHLTFVPKLLLKVPVLMIIISILSVWPGVWLTDSMIRTYFTSYDFNTNLWYIPLTVLSLVWYGISGWRRSTKEARDSAHEVMLAIQSALPGATLTSYVGGVGEQHLPVQQPTADP